MENTIGIAIETSGRIGSVCLSRGLTVLEEVRFSGKMRHSSELMPAIKKITEKHKLKPSNVGFFFFPIGPGSFTGLRIAVTMAKMLAFALPVRLIAVNSLDAIAESAMTYLDASSPDITRTASILDAKKNLFYISMYERNKSAWEKTESDLLISAEEFLSKYISPCEQKTALLGEGLVYYREKFSNEKTFILPEDFWPACAQNVLKAGWQKVLAGEFANPDTLLPFYIRRPEAVEKWENRNINKAAQS